MKKILCDVTDKNVLMFGPFQNKAFPLDGLYASYSNDYWNVNFIQHPLSKRISFTNVQAYFFGPGKKPNPNSMFRTFINTDLTQVEMLGNKI